MLEAYDEVIERAAAELRAPVHLDARFDARVMDEVRREQVRRSGGLAGFVDWLVRPRTVRVSPLRLAAVAGALGIVVALAGRQGTESAAVPDSEPLAAADAPHVVAMGDSAIVTFMLRAPGASSVALVGDFNNWSVNATPMRRATGDVWAVAVPLAKGRYTYNFVVDGREWRIDPSAPSVADDAFGRPSSLLMVAGA